MADSAKLAPIFVIGAARSGTKMLRRVVALHEGVAEVPFDINYVWTLGSRQIGHDAIPSDDADPKLRSTLDRFFGRFAGDHDAIVEKTVGNSLRVPFVARLYPEARFLFLFRDGLDVTASSLRQWQSRPRARMLWPKIRTFPWWAAREYAWQYLRAQMGVLLGVTDSVRSWGPVYPGMDEDVRDLALATVCARQWRSCVEAMLESEAGLSPEQVLRLRYEDFVADPRVESSRIAEFLERSPRPELRSYVETSIRSSSVSRWKRTLADSELEAALPLVDDLRGRLGYEAVSGPRSFAD